jgi:hypothetical protein
VASDNRGMPEERTVKSCYMSRMIKEERMGVHTMDFRVKPHMMFVTCRVVDHDDEKITGVFATASESNSARTGRALMQHRA